MPAPRLAAAATLAVAAALAGSPRAARASDVDQFGFGARPIAMGNAFTALATDFTGSYYNPAAPALSERSTFAVGFSYGHYALDYTSEVGANDSDVERQTPLSAFTIGLSTPLSRDPDAFLSRLAFSIGAFIPTRVVVGAEVETAPGTPQYFLYGSRRDKIGVLPALGIRILPLDGPAMGEDEEGGHGQALSVGIGATLLADIAGSFTFDLSSTAARSVAVEQKLSHDLAPNFGIFYWPAEWLSLGLAYRGQLSLKADFDVQIVVDGTNLFPLALEAVTLFQPQQIVLGAAVDPTDSVTVSLDLTWANWSAYEDPFVTIRPVIPQADVDFDDILIPRVGFEFLPAEGWALRAGYYFQPSPIPPQRGATNLIDLDKHVVSLGAGWRGESIGLDAFVQWHILPSETVNKDPAASPQTGGFYEAGGDVFNFGIQLTIRT